MEPRRGFGFYQEAERQRQDERLFLRWVNGYQAEMNFQDFKQKAMVAAVPATVGKQMSEAEIYGKVRGILRRE